jgi:L-cysteine S-thiosulfotransferase
MARLRVRASGLAGCLSLVLMPMLMSALLAPSPGMAQAAAADGRSLFIDPRKGNCSACHQVPGDRNIKSLSKIGPPLVDMKSRFLERARLRAIIWDLTRSVPDTIMPPYGRHRILTEPEIEAIVRYVETL